MVTAEGENRIQAKFRRPEIRDVQAGLVDSRAETA